MWGIADWHPSPGIGTMRKFLLIASVAAMAVTAPASAERGGRKGEEQQARSQPTRGGGGQKAERVQAREPRVKQERPQRTERAFQPQFESRERPQQRAERIEQRDRAPRMMARQQAAERRAGPVETRQARRPLQERTRIQEARRIEQARDRAAAQDRARVQRVERTRTFDNQDRINRQRAMAAERQTAGDQQRQAQIDRRSRFEQAQTDRRSRLQQQAVDRTAIQQAETDRRSRIQQLAAERSAFTGDDTQWRNQLWERRVQRERSLAELRDRRFARLSAESEDRRVRNDFFRIGERVDQNWWYDDYVPLRYRSSFFDNDSYYYRYDGDYLYRLDRNDDVVLSLFPILGGAYSVGRPMPYYYDSYYNVPVGYSSLYYDSPSSYYRYGDGAIYGINPTTQLITGIVALLTGQNFGIGQPMPLGYDVYNVPYAYRSSYYDTPDMWYRYDDGFIYGVDPRTRLIQTSYPVYGGYMVGNPWPSYAGYGYEVPNYYNDLYYDAPGYDYRYASGGIYQVDPKTQLIAALAALVTGQNFNVGQRLPLGYDAYNVPFAYRDQYYDNDDYWYRYADGRILQVDPGTRVIRRVILV